MRGLPRRALEVPAIFVVTLGRPLAPVELKRKLSIRPAFADGSQLRRALEIQPEFCSLDRLAVRPCYRAGICPGLDRFGLGLCLFVGRAGFGFSSRGTPNAKPTTRTDAARTAPAVLIVKLLEPIDFANVATAGSGWTALLIVARTSPGDMLAFTESAIAANKPVESVTPRRVTRFRNNSRPCSNPFFTEPTVCRVAPLPRPATCPGGSTGRAAHEWTPAAGRVLRGESHTLHATKGRQMLPWFHSHAVRSVRVACVRLGPGAHPASDAE